MKIKFNWDVIFEAMKWDLVSRLKEEAPTHDGELKRSIRAIIKDDKLQIYMLGYALCVERGSVPHWTSVDNLKKWARDKLGDEKLAYALQRHVALYGTRPNNFIERTIKNNFKAMLIKALQVKGAITVE